MQSYIETLGRLIASRCAPSTSARRMLTAAYSWVRFSGKRKKLTDAKSAYARMNGRVADTLIRGMNQPQQAVMVNIFMPCELMHAMGLTPMFPEGLSVSRRLHGLPACLCRTRGNFRHSGELLLLPQDDDRHGGIRRAAQTAADRRNDAGL